MLFNRSTIFTCKPVVITIIPQFLSLMRSGCGLVLMDYASIILGEIGASEKQE